MLAFIQMGKRHPHQDLDPILESSSLYLNVVGCLMCTNFDLDALS